MIDKNPSDTILILDFGDPSVFNIADCLGQTNQCGEIVPHSISAEEIQAAKPKGIIFSGGPSSVYTPGAPLPSPDIFTLNIPLLGICYGMQAIAHSLGGVVTKAETPEQGETKTFIRHDHALFKNLSNHFITWMNHNDEVTMLPPEFICIAQTTPDNHTVMAHRTRKIWGVQFHPETAPQHGGLQLFQNFCDLLSD